MNLKRFVVALLFLGSSVAMSEPLETVHVFADSDVRVPHMPTLEIFVYDLREASYHKENPLIIPFSSAEEAKRVASNIQSLPEYKQYMNTVKQSYLPYQIIGELGISRIPAIVFNRGTHVVYGTTDIAQAIADYQQFMRSEGAKQ